MRARSSRSPARRPRRPSRSRTQLTADEIRILPGTGNDILRAAQALPGVARIPFAFGGLVLRGTSPRDTAVYLDGIEVPIAFHFGGVTSFYPSGMLAELTLTAGGFDASYGRAQGGLVTLTTREPRTDRWRIGGSIGLLDSGATAEGPWQRRRVRRSACGAAYFDTVVDRRSSPTTCRCRLPGRPGPAVVRRAARSAVGSRR